MPIECVRARACVCARVPELPLRPEGDGVAAARAPGGSERRGRDAAVCWRYGTVVMERLLTQKSARGPAAQSAAVETPRRDVEERPRRVKSEAAT